jgi:GntR family uxuAB operon transcriptional repressor
MPRRRYLQVAEQLLAAIERGDYPPGSRLPGDREIAASTHVSRPTVREALLALEIVGAIEVQPGIGAKVNGTGASWDPDRELAALGAPRDLMETRALVEPIVAGLCADRIQQDDLDRLRIVVNSSFKAEESDAPLSQLSELGLDFHLELSRSCGNAVLSDVVCHLVDIEEHPLWALINRIALRGEGIRREQNHEHLAILDAIEAKDARSARTKMAAHLERTNTLLFGDPRPMAGIDHRTPARRRLLRSTEPTN